MKTILYIHGFGSLFDSNSSKVTTLSQLGNVIGYNIDYTVNVKIWFEGLVKFVIDNSVDLLVGTSLGGWTAAKVSEETGLPFIALNPSVLPSQTLSNYAGYGTTFFDKNYFLSQRTIFSYHDISLNGNGLILLEKGDTVLDANISYNMLKDSYEVYMFEKGSHRFDSLHDRIDLINNFLNRVSISTGMSNE